MSDNERRVKIEESIYFFIQKYGLSESELRFIKIGTIDFQPCGGTHVKKTNEIGEIKIGKIENKGKMNRRVNILLND